MSIHVFHGFSAPQRLHAARLGTHALDVVLALILVFVRGMSVFPRDDNLLPRRSYVRSLLSASGSWAVIGGERVPKVRRQVLLRDDLLVLNRLLWLRLVLERAMRYQVVFENVELCGTVLDVWAFRLSTLPRSLLRHCPRIFAIFDQLPMIFTIVIVEVQLGRLSLVARVPRLIISRAISSANICVLESRLLVVGTRYRDRRWRAIFEKVNLTVGMVRIEFGLRLLLANVGKVALILQVLLLLEIPVALIPFAFLF